MGSKIAIVEKEGKSIAKLKKKHKTAIGYVK